MRCNERNDVWQCGFTLVELMIVIVIIGVLAALASFGFMQYVKKAKSAEADSIVAKLSSGAKIYFTTEQKAGQMEPWHSGAAGFPVPFASYTFPGGTGYTFHSHTEVPSGGTKVAPDYDRDDATAQVVLMKLAASFADPTYFRYTYHTGDSSGGSAQAVISATADFQPGGDGHTLTQNVTVSKQQEVLIAPPFVENEFE